MAHETSNLVGKLDVILKNPFSQTTELFRQQILGHIHVIAAVSKYLRRFIIGAKDQKCSILELKQIVKKSCL